MKHTSVETDASMPRPISTKKQEMERRRQRCIQHVTFHVGRHEYLRLCNFFISKGALLAPTAALPRFRDYPLLAFVRMDPVGGYIGKGRTCDVQYS